MAQGGLQNVIYDNIINAIYSIRGFTGLVKSRNIKYYRTAGNFQGRKLSRIDRKGSFRGEKLSRNAKTGRIMGVAYLEFRGENFRGWLKNCKICKNFLPRKIPAIQ